MAEVVTFVDPGRQPKRSQDDRRERKLFMSSKASDVLKDVAPKPKAPARSKVPDDKLYFANFDSIFQGVETLGNSQLPWKERKKLEQRKLETLGAKPVKTQKMAPELGLHIKRKREAQEALRRQEDVAAGNLVKRRKTETARRKSEDRGLQASEGTFRNGVLYVTPLGQIGAGSKKKGRKFKGKKK